MKTNYLVQRKRFKFLCLCFIVALILSSCGPSAEERERQRTEDSLQLEIDRTELLDRANRMFESSDPEDDEALQGNEE